VRVVQTSVVIGAPLPDVDALELAPRLKAESGSRSMAVVMLVTPDSAAHVVETTTDVVRRIFRDYARGKSMKAIAHALNTEGAPFPAKDTKRGPARRGWAVSRST
jgi:hypothetical protein